MFMLTTLFALVGCLDGAEGDSGWRDTAASAVVDGDGDGFPADVDCDDADPARSPDAVDDCDGVDNDCDGAIDEDPVKGLLGYDDKDGDGYGEHGSMAPRCELGEGVVLIGEDCDDNNPGVNPAQAELCLDDGVDEDCDGLIDAEDPTSDRVQVYEDRDGDGFGDSDRAEWRCGASATWSLQDGDCDTFDSERYPGATERCDQMEDLDCDYLYGCEDGDCAAETYCMEVCDNGVDDEGDGATDCEDDECWALCDPRVQTNLHGGSADLQFWTSWSSGGHSYTVQGTAYSLTGSVQLTSGSEVVICDWRVPRVEFNARYRETFSSLTAFSGAHGSHEVELSSACPRAELPVLPPKIGALPDGGAMTGLGAWIAGPITLRSVKWNDRGWYGGSVESKGSIPTLSPATARWGDCALTQSTTGSPCTTKP